MFIDHCAWYKSTVNSFSIFESPRSLAGLNRCIRVKVPHWVCWPSSFSALFRCQRLKWLHFGRRSTTSFVIGLSWALAIPVPRLQIIWNWLYTGAMFREGLSWTYYHDLASSPSSFTPCWQQSWQSSNLQLVPRGDLAGLGAGMFCWSFFRFVCSRHVTRDDCCSSFVAYGTLPILIHRVQECWLFRGELDALLQPA